MTGQDLVLKVKYKLNQLDTTSNRAIAPELVLLFLNDAYIKLVRAKYTKSPDPADRSSFQLRQLDTDELDHLVSRGSKSSPTLDSEFGEYVISVENTTDFPDYFVHLRSSMLVQSGSSEFWVHNPNYKTLDTVGTTYQDPFNKSNPMNPIIYFDGGVRIVKGDDFTVSKYSMTYLKTPPEITLASVHEFSFVDEVVDRTVELILEEWESPRTQSHLGITNAISNL